MFSEGRIAFIGKDGIGRLTCQYLLCCLELTVFMESIVSEVVYFDLSSMLNTNQNERKSHRYLT